MLIDEPCLNTPLFAKKYASLLRGEWPCPSLHLKQERLLRTSSLSNDWHLEANMVRYLYFRFSLSSFCHSWVTLLPFAAAAGPEVKLKQPSLRGTNLMLHSFLKFILFSIMYGAGEQHWLRLLNDFGIVDKRYHNEIVSKWHKHLASQIKGRRPADRSSSGRPSSVVIQASFT